MVCTWPSSDKRKLLTRCYRSDRSKDGDLCYKQMNWIDAWMNDSKNKKALGVNPELDFQSCNMEVNQAFFGQGDGMHNSAALLPPLIEDGVRLLVYAGNADMMCNYMVRSISCASGLPAQSANYCGLG